MPPKKVRMDAKVAALEGEMSEVKSTLIDVQNAVKTSHESLMAMFERCLGKTILEEEGSANGKGRPYGFHNLSRDALTEFRQSFKKVELPSFTGEDPAEWISRAEVYFRVQGTLPELKVSLAQLCMEGATIHFFNYLVGEYEDLSWEKLKESLLARYGDHGDGDVYEQLTGLKQSGTVEKYITEVEYLMAQIPKLTNKQFLGYFLHGLKAEIRGRVRSFVAMGEMSRARLLQVTRAVEKEIYGENGSSSNRGPRFGSGSHRPGTHGAGRGNSYWVLVKNREGGVNGGSKSNAIGLRDERAAHGDKRRNGPRDRGFQHLSYQELMDRKQKGLCFKCKGSFSPTHQCPDKHLRILLVDDSDTEELEGQVLAIEVNEAEDYEM